MPMTAFIGVRISWLMFARNALLAWVASSALAMACRNSVAIRLISVISVNTPAVPNKHPSVPTSGNWLERKQRSSPPTSRSLFRACGAIV